MILALLVAAVVLTIVLPAIWICRVNRNVRRDYTKRWDKLNEKVGGVLPPYESLRDKGDKK